MGGVYEENTNSSFQLYHSCFFSHFIIFFLYFFFSGRAPRINNPQKFLEERSTATPAPAPTTTAAFYAPCSKTTKIKRKEREESRAEERRGTESCKWREGACMHVESCPVLRTNPNRCLSAAVVAATATCPRHSPLVATTAYTA